MAMKICQFGLPEGFSDADVPEEVRHLCAAIDGQELSYAATVAADRGLCPLLFPLGHLGIDKWYFGLTVNQSRIPLMVTVVDVEDFGHAQH